MIGFKPNYVYIPARSDLGIYSRPATRRVDMKFVCDTVMQAMIDMSIPIPKK